jgi:hypothetical protein
LALSHPAHAAKSSASRTSGTVCDALRLTFVVIPSRLYRKATPGESQYHFLDETINAEDDDAALIAAQRYLKGRALEMWAGDRRVAFIPADE